MMKRTVLIVLSGCPRMSEIDAYMTFRSRAAKPTLGFIQDLCPLSSGLHTKTWREPMPFVKIHVLEGQYNETRIGKVSSAVQDALITALGVPTEDFYQAIHVLPRGQFRHTPSFLELNYSDDLIVLEP